MQVQFRCNHPLPPQLRSGDGDRCRQVLEADENHAGLKVRCPRCRQLSVVPSREAVAANGATEDGNAGHEPPGLTEVLKGRSGNRQSGEVGYHQFNRKSRCPRCGALLGPEGHCTACRYQTPKLLAAKTPLDEIPIQTAGFQLWLQQIMSDALGVKVLTLAIHGMVAFAMFLILIAGVILGGQLLGVAIAVVSVVGSAYALTTFQTWRMSHVPAAPIPWLARPFWWLILVCARSMDWRRYDSRLRNRIVIDVREEAFGDRELLALEKLTAAEVLDAQGTTLTDGGLALLHGMKNLRCVVVRKTHVSREAVFRLQQSIPRCWIWY